MDDLSRILNLLYHWWKTIKLKCKQSFRNDSLANSLSTLHAIPDDQSRI